MMHEASLYEENCFITLTYDDEHLPRDGSLDVSHFQKFMKRLRKRFADDRIRFFHCGEYGDTSARPHYHACLFGFDFRDKRVWSVRGDHIVWRSETLEETWQQGLSEIGTLTFESAAYVARYVTKKVTGPLADEHYERVNPLTGELVRVAPEYATMSRRPGIGRGWIEKYHEDVYPWDEVVVNGHPSKPPRYYDLYAAERNPKEFESVSRERRISRRREDETPERLHVREVCTKARLLPRGF